MERMTVSIMRPPKKSDQENCNKVMMLLADLIDSNPDIEGAIWISCFLSIASQQMFVSGLTKDQFCSEIDTMKAHHCNLWKEWEKSYESYADQR